MAMRLPFPRFLANTAITVTLTEGIDENGEPVKKEIFSGGCIYREKMRQILDAERRLITLYAKAVIEGDIYPGEDIEGFVKVADGPERKIFQASRPRNPDGSVFSTELDLM